MAAVGQLSDARCEHEPLLADFSDKEHRGVQNDDHLEECFPSGVLKDGIRRTRQTGNKSANKPFSVDVTFNENVGRRSPVKFCTGPHSPTLIHCLVSAA